MAAKDLNEAGFVVDFSDISKWIMQYDHHDLNEFFENPTAEILAQRFFEMLSHGLDERVLVVRVKVYETGTCWASYDAT